MDWLNADVATVAQRLLGCELVRTVDGQVLAGRIVETEAYDQTDAASHSYRGETPRTAVMFGLSGHLYVYFTYGMHYCMNVVTGPVGHGAAVLIRALEPLQGIAMMAKNRHGRGMLELTNGPAKVCQAMAVNKQWNGHDLQQGDLRLIVRPEVPISAIVQTARIGISKNTAAPLRFYIADSSYVSRPR